ncbi:hypothetical protein DUNSADRAFT_10402 [Dunaliella salina]|uniref:Cytochrome b5 heme-binding domain-containing protein n=1 Tax=Dunaliella salina TaxID=3046 RepID=A0ABQ7FS96_DUNSA|nr:hypothetical protein DUNSADRAFT_10402 [Dunaliella salina]|eukprot:KAF5825412.1 hypothetical protein DUNSADRAFT_10402 [Dunaliella salina]
MAGSDAQGDRSQQKCPQDSEPNEPAEHAKAAAKGSSSPSEKNANLEARPPHESQHKRKRGRPFLLRAELLILSAILSACIAFLMYYNHEESPETRLFTDEQLELFTGERNSPMFLAILGEVFDVTKGKDKYGEWLPRMALLHFEGVYIQLKLHAAK